MIKPLFYLLAILFVVGCSSQQTELCSPNRQIRISLSIRDDGSLGYRLYHRDSIIISDSPLGLVAREGINLSTGFRIIDTRTTSIDEIWSQPWGENKRIRNHYNELAVDLVNDQHIALTLRMRLFDDGLGFRYEYSQPISDSTFVTDELTGFNMANTGDSWSIPGSFESYEWLYRSLPIDSVKDANTPITIRSTDSTYLSIHEAALTDFPEMTLLNIGARHFKAHLAPWPDGDKAKMGSQFTTPWRTIQVADQAIGLINSSLILNLNEPCVLEQTDWIRPFKYIGIWWAMHLGTETWRMDSRHGATTANAKRYIDFAHEHQIQAVLFEGWNQGWESWGGMQHFDFTAPYDDFDMDEIVRYASQRSIEIVGHHETGGNIPNYEQQLEKAIKWYADYGVHSLKTGYAGAFPNGQFHHGQYGVRHYRKVVEVAARHKIMVNAHEPIKDTGIRRTYPNMMTREGARGMEWNAWSSGNPPEHYEILPFTRLLSGPMDYTPGTFDILFEKTKHLPTRAKWNDQDQGTSRVHTTLAKQLANWVILYSPMQMASDLIEHYKGHPAFEFFRSYDPDCDASQALAGEPGEYVVIMRRAKDRYFIGATTNQQPREVAVALDFLDPQLNYRAIIYRDGPDAHWESNPTDYKIDTIQVDSHHILSLQLASSGGAAVTIEVL